MWVKPQDTSSPGPMNAYRKSNIFKQLQESRAYNSVCNKDCFLDRATTEYQLKMKEAMHIKWIRPKLNEQVKH